MKNTIRWRKTLIWIHLILLCACTMLVQGCIDVTRPRGDGADTEIRSAWKSLGQGDKKSALQAFDRAVAHDPKDAYTHVTVVRMLAVQELHSESIPYIEDALRRPKADGGGVSGLMDRLWDSELYLIMGNAYSRLNKITEAERAYRQAVLLNSENAAAYNNWGYMYAERGIKPDEALRLAHRAVELDSRNGCYADSLGWAYFQKGDVRNARKHLKMAAKLLPSDPEIRYHLGRAYEAESDVEAALIEYRKALTVAPSFKPALEAIGRLHRGRG